MSVSVGGQPLYQVSTWETNKTQSSSPTWPHLQMDNLFESIYMYPRIGTDNFNYRTDICACSIATAITTLVGVGGEEPEKKQLGMVVMSVRSWISVRIPICIHGLNHVGSRRRIVIHSIVAVITIVRIRICRDDFRNGCGTI